MVMWRRLQLCRVVPLLTERAMGLTIMRCSFAIDMFELIERLLLATERTDDRRSRFCPPPQIQQPAAGFGLGLIAHSSVPCCRSLAQ
jgi:hypothetical protein